MTLEVAPVPSRAHHAPMADFKCWFCAKRIEREDAAAVMITIESFWRWHDDVQDGRHPAQMLYAHAECARICLIGAGGTIDPTMFAGEE